MLSELSLIVVVVAITLVIAGHTVNRIPKTGRDGKANGEKISATITNKNKYADAAVTLRAEKDGRKFKVEMKPTEAHLWIPGDSIDIIMNEDGKNYRVLFNDYFRENESRIREKAVELLEKVRLCHISSIAVGYKKEFKEEIVNSSLDSQQIFAFVSYMKQIDIYSVFAVILTGGIVWWKFAFSPEAKEFILPCILIIVAMWSIYNAVEMCKRILKKAVKQNQK